MCYLSLAISTNYEGKDFSTMYEKYFQTKLEQNNILYTMTLVYSSILEWDKLMSVSGIL
jgi:hypothetical protein